jgi:hypothetical protein
LVGDILAGDGKIYNLFYSVFSASSYRHKLWPQHIENNIKREGRETITIKTMLGSKRHELEVKPILTTTKNYAFFTLLVPWRKNTL